MNNSLTSGIKPKELVRRASTWWDKTGRYLIGHKFNTTQLPGKFRPANGKSPAIQIKGEKQAVLPSGILNQLPWSALTKDEKHRVASTYHQVMVLDVEQGYDVENPHHYNNVRKRLEINRNPNGSTENGDG